MDQRAGEGAARARWTGADWRGGKGERGSVTRSGSRSHLARRLDGRQQLGEVSGGKGARSVLTLENMLGNAGAR